MKKKAKIAILIPRYGLVDRGAEVFTKDFLKFLSKDFEITIFTRASGLPSAKKILALPAEIKILAPTKFLEKFFLNPDGIEMLTFSIFSFPYLLFGDFDLLFPQNGIWGAIICRIVRAIKGTPFIYRSAGGKEPSIIRQKPNIYVATTPEIFRWIKNYNPKVGVVLIPNGVNTKSFNPSVIPISVGLKRPIYLAVAALISAKRIELTIRAMAELKRGSLLVLGRGPLERRLKSLGKRLLGESRFLVTSAPHDKMPRYYRACNYFTLASESEPFGIVYLEAMASGLPIVTTADETRRYIIGNAGELCSVTDIKAYSDALFNVSRIKYSDLPIRQARKFSWEKTSRRYKALLNTELSLSRHNYKSPGPF